jgi:hypothetical protein
VRPALFNIIRALVPEADLLIDTMTVRPQGNRAFLISDTIRRLKAADIWQKLDVLWMLAAHDAQAARLNWKAPASFALTAVNSPTFTADRGYAGNGSSSYLNTGWDGATNGVNFTQDNASAFVWDLTNRGGITRCSLGNSSTTSATTIYPRSMANVYFGRVNDFAAGGLANTSSDGFFITNRTSSTALTSYRNAVSIGSHGSVSSVAMASQDFYIGALNNVGTAGLFSSDQHACAGMGADLDSQQGALYNIMRSYMRTVGAAT